MKKETPGNISLTAILVLAVFMVSGCIYNPPSTTYSPSTTPPVTTSSMSSNTGTASSSATSTASATSSTTSSVQKITIDLIAQNIAFDKNTITVPAGAKVTVNFDNKDNGVPHNFAVYTDSSASTSIFVGKIITGPTTTTYTFTAPTTPGNYFFRCDVHPTIMTGTFVVQ